jgi:hypothetical protein
LGRILKSDDDNAKLAIEVNRKKARAKWEKYKQLLTSENAIGHF